MMKSKLMRAATLLMVLTLMTSCFVGSTFAKYTSTASGNDTAKVAKWAIEVTGDGEAQDISVTTPPEITFDLFKTVYEVDATTADDDVKAGLNLIAPGTGGKFNFDVENKSEVTAAYTITLATEASTALPIEYSLNGTDWETDITALNGDTALTDIELAIGSAKQETATVYWRWAFTGAESANYTSWTDAQDTALGIAAKDNAATLKVTATITVTQVD